MRIRAIIIALILSLTAFGSATAQEIIDTLNTEEVPDTVYDEEETDWKEDTLVSFRNPDYVSPLRAVPDSVAEAMKGNKDFSYANDPSYWEEEPRSDPAFFKWLSRLAHSRIFEWILYIILGVIVVFVLYQVIVVNNFFMVGKSRKNKNADDDTAGEEMTIEDLDRKIQESIASKAFRPAIRYLYLKTLRVLNDRNLIRFHAKSTNQDYLRQISGTPEAPAFRQLTYLYEYVWYGGFDPGDRQFDTIHDHFNQFLSRH